MREYLLSETNRLQRDAQTKWVEVTRRVMSPLYGRSREAELILLNEILGLERKMKGIGMLIRYCETLNANSRIAFAEQGKPDERFLPLIHGIAWSSPCLNLNCLTYFNESMQQFFNTDNLAAKILAEDKVDPQLKEYFKTPQLSVYSEELNRFAQALIDQNPHSLTLEKLNEVNHRFFMNLVQQQQPPATAFTQPQ